MEGGFGPKIVFEIAGIKVTETVTNTWIIMALLILFSFLATRKLEQMPKGLQNFVELLVDGIYKLTAQTMGKDKIGFAPYIGTLLIYLVCANLAGLFALRPPTADVNTTMGLALITFFMIHFFGMKRKGVGKYLKGFLDPIPLMLPMNIISELATPISLSFRLFGNIVGGLIIMSLLYGGLAGIGAKLGIMIPIFQVGIPVPLHLYFDVFAGVLQSFIFSMLTMVFVSMAMD
ncbi:F0F1 ATP synthase subunit A [Crassaminicella indica]|uniref:ATP synthase subunit a n=1 Tax=Crassaminicella indica TaxID=2855394 RepID=A0ABX8REK0_9CLOT|nr:F0F1 ATP synthase subunit A [Crassaminicella indica]QXM06712.1 F0F1 ATP synthase subunit A [Crassaminicella indica]